MAYFKESFKEKVWRNMKRIKTLRKRKVKQKRRKENVLKIQRSYEFYKKINVQIQL